MGGIFKGGRGVFHGGTLETYGGNLQSGSRKRPGGSLSASGKEEHTLEKPFSDMGGARRRM